jgi:hypothetical protein
MLLILQHLHTDTKGSKILVRRQLLAAAAQ